MRWERRASLDQPAQEIGVVAAGGRVYALGGFDASLQLSDAVRVYDPATDTWSRAAPLPRPVHHANVAAVGGRVYVVGAMVLDGFDFVAIGDVWAYDPAADAWTPRTPMPAGTERGAAATAAVDGRIYVAGGLRGGQAVADVSAYDPDADTWDTDLPPLPAPRDHLVGAAVDGVLYAIGGRNGAIDAVSDRVDAYAPGGGWTPRAPLPTARGGCAAATVGGRIAVVGGEGNPDAPSGVFAAAELYDPAADAWTALPPPPTPRHGMGAAAVDGVVYVPGGATRQGFAAVADVEALVGLAP
ncbi:MAG: kelch repeat-containing protein [Deltaproteobacteria bacterium]|nr:MAG: kelch repeat-containing protein [Deltaproteobacteria bacterium]